MARVHDEPTADPERIARRLGLTEELVRRLQARGVLRTLDLSDAAIRRRLLDGHVGGSPATRAFHVIQGDENR